MLQERGVLSDLGVYFLGFIDDYIKKGEKNSDAQKTKLEIECEIISEKDKITGKEKSYLYIAIGNNAGLAFNPDLVRYIFTSSDYPHLRNYLERRSKERGEEEKLEQLLNQAA